MDLDLSGKRALVCGSSQGIGLAAAIELAELGTECVLFARNAETLGEVIGQLSSSHGQNHEYITADFAHPAEVRDALSKYLEGGKTFHIVVNNTGGPPAGPAIEADAESFRIAFNNHLVNNHQIVQLCLNGMKEAGYGRVINIISTSVKIPLNGLGVSNTVRGAVANWSKTLANELGQYNITVNNVLPGATNTVRLESIVENKAGKTGKTPDEIAEQMANAVPMKRIGEPHEVGAAIAFLASPAASYINGVNIPVDGGRTGSL